MVAYRLWSMGVVVAFYQLSSYEACGTFQDRGLNVCLLHWQVDSLPPSHSSSVQLCDPMDCSTAGLPVHPQLPDFTEPLGKP